MVVFLVSWTSLTFSVQPIFVNLGAQRQLTWPELFLHLAFSKCNWYTLAELGWLFPWHPHTPEKVEFIFFFHSNALDLLDAWREIDRISSRPWLFRNTFFFVKTNLLVKKGNKTILPPASADKRRIWAVVKKSQNAAKYSYHGFKWFLGFFSARFLLFSYWTIANPDQPLTQKYGNQSDESWKKVNGDSLVGTCCCCCCCCCCNFSFPLWAHGLTAWGWPRGSPCQGTGDLWPFGALAFSKKALLLWRFFAGLILSNRLYIPWRIHGTIVYLPTWIA